MNFKWMMPMMEGVDMGGGGGADPVSEAITSSISGLSDNAPDGSGDDPAPLPAAAQEPVAKTPEEEAEEKELAALEQEIRGKNPTMRGNIAIHRHQAVLTRARNQHAKALEEWAAKEKAWAEEKAKHEAAVKEWDSYGWAKDPDVIEALQLIALADKDQKAFVEALMTDSRFAELIQFKNATPVPSTRPRPNAKTEDGALEYYDDAGLEELLKWHGAETSKAAKEEILKEVEKRYGPLADAYQQTTSWNKAIAKSKTDLDQMRAEWVGFAEFEKDIKALMMAPGNEKMDAREAYIRVVPGKLAAREKANKEAMRKELIEEMNAKRAAADGAIHSNPNPERGADPAEGEDDDPVGNAIRRSIRNIRE